MLRSNRQRLVRLHNHQQVTLIISFKVFNLIFYCLANLGFSFGTTAPATNTSLFGAPAQQPVAGFGAPAAAPAQQPAATGFSFNAPSAAAPTQPAFGASATPTLGTGLGTGFGANTSTTPGFGTLGGLSGTTAGAATGSTFGKFLKTFMHVYIIYLKLQHLLLSFILL